jgi:hypothetical protein
MPSPLDEADELRFGPLARVVLIYFGSQVI